MSPTPEQYLLLSSPQDKFFYFLFDLPQTLLDALTQGFTAAEATQGIPGEKTSFVRAYASLLVEEIKVNSSVPSEQIEDYQARHAGEMSTGAVLPRRHQPLRGIPLVFMYQLIHFATFRCKVLTFNSLHPFDTLNDLSRIMIYKLPSRCVAISWS